MTSMISKRLKSLVKYINKENKIIDIGCDHALLDIYLIKNNNNITVKEIAKNLGYTESHISRIFHQYIGYTIPHYTNILRLSYIEKNLKKKEGSLTQLIMESGFKSLQSYYRNKKLFENFSPSTNPKN